jgi:hypothetical protein
VSRTRCGILYAAPQSRDRDERRCLVRSRFCEAALRKSYALHRARDTGSHNQKTRLSFSSKRGGSNSMSSPPGWASASARLMVSLARARISRPSTNARASPRSISALAMTPARARWSGTRSRSTLSRTRAPYNESARSQSLRSSRLSRCSDRSLAARRRTSSRAEGGTRTSTLTRSAAPPDLRYFSMRLRTEIGIPCLASA